ncbi:hypothetical protein [Maricaulis sp.]|uniref:hypothetical protein n=1 Tax=Maricaulis sp. TaxID=1486257 RepID=UPI003A937EB6
MTAELQSIFQPELDPGERILWTGRPTPARLAMMKYGLPMAVLFFACVWAIPSMIEEVSIGRPQSAVAIAVACALVILFTGFFVAALGAWRTVYAVTDRRVLVVTPPGFLQSKTSALSYPPAMITQIQRSGDDEVADLIFVKTHTPQNRHAALSVVQPFQGLIGIADARRVERLIRQTLLRG